MPQTFDRADQCVDEILRRVGRRLVVGLPIGIGKPIPLVNELYRRAVADPSIDLTLLTISPPFTSDNAFSLLPGERKRTGPSPEERTDLSDRVVG